MLRLPSGDVIDGSFSGLWGDGVKVNGTFRKAAEVTPSHRRKTRLVKPIPSHSKLVYSLKLVVVYIYFVFS